MKTIERYRLRKCSDINLELPFYEVLDDDGSVLFDVSESTEGTVEILFYEGCANKRIAASLLADVVVEVKAMLMREKSDNGAK